MVMIRIHSHGAPRAVHPGWLEHTLADIGNAKLREAILATDRFTGRLVRSLLGDSALDLANPVQISPQMALLSDQVDDGFLNFMGQLWYAPVLAPRLLGAGRRAFAGLDDRQTLRRLLAYRGHTSPESVGPLPHDPDFHQQGLLCLFAWLDTRRDDDAANRLRLTLPPQQSTDQPCHAERAALVAFVLQDPDIMGR